MNRATADTIAAVATPPGRGGIGVIRISGPCVAEIGLHLLGELPQPRRARYAPFRDADGSPLDHGVVLYFPAPKSFTGEDVLELQGHGGAVVLDLILARVIALGARVARPGEFSERAFLNDKLDLAQAEAIADLIDAGSAQAARAAVRSLDGEFSTAIRTLVEQLIALRSHIEASLDFSDEDIDFLADGRIREKLSALSAELTALLTRSTQGRLLRDGFSVVLAGQPNVGKSSLLNALAGTEAAIVTEIPGTTRDVLREHLNIDGLPLKIIDTAGLRDSSDPVEQEGIRRARAEIEKADRVLLLVDDRYGIATADQAILASLPARLPVTRVHNKCDLSGHGPSQEGDTIRLSAKTGTGLDLLRRHLKDSAGFAPPEGVFIARRRHLDALERAQRCVQNAAAQLEQHSGAELVAEELRLAQLSLNEITGEFTPDDLLGRIFSSFCIGK